MHLRRESSATLDGRLDAKRIAGIKRYRIDVEVFKARLMGENKNVQCTSRR